MSGNNEAILLTIIATLLFSIHLFRKKLAFVRAEPSLEKPVYRDFLGRETWYVPWGEGGYSWSGGSSGGYSRFGGGGHGGGHR